MSDYRNFVSALLSAMAWPATLLGLASIIDNPWHVATRRAENAGKQLAEVLANRQQVVLRVTRPHRQSPL